MADDEQFSLCWNNFNTNLSAGFHESLCRGDLVDVTLAAEGQFIKAHRLVLSVCSPYFRKMFTQMPTNQHAFVFLKDVSHCALKDLIQFMYCGEVNVKQDALPAFISTAEALQIKGLTDGDPAPSQSPAKPSTPAPSHQLPAQPTIATVTSPRVKPQQQRTTSNVRQQTQYKIESQSDDSEKQTQIVLQATTPVVSTQQQSQPQTIQVQLQPQHTVQIHSTTTATAAITQKRQAQKSISAHQAKRTKIIQADPLDSSEPTQITVQTIAENKSVGSDGEYIDLPMELPTKSEPEYAEEAGEVETVEQEASYVEDDSYGDMKYDESYFTENDDAGAPTSSGAATSAATTVPTQTVKQSQSFSESFVGDAGDQSATEAQGASSIQFIRSQKKNAQLVYRGYIYNKKLTQANGHTTWRCADVLKLKCKAVCITKLSKLLSARREHNHVQHWTRIGNRPLYDIEEELGEYIEIKANDPKFPEMYQVSHYELSSTGNGKEQFKVYMQPTDAAVQKNFEKIIEEIQ